MALSQEDVEKLEESFAKFEGKEPIVFPVMIDKDHGVHSHTNEAYTCLHCSSCRLILRR